MITVGLTGSFGSGKSYVAGLFKKLGACVVDADIMAHAALKTGSATYRKIVSKFGRSILHSDGSVDRKALGRVVFSDRKKLNALNRMIHPVVIAGIKKKMGAPGKGVLVVDAPLICEAGMSGMFDMLIVVKASRQKQIERCVKKFNLCEKDVCKRMACQMPLNAKIRRADHVIDNNGTRKETEKQVTKIWQELKKGATVWR
jgi:dephospho-CoA kinase